MAYDRSDWHHGGDYPEDLPDENAGTHIGMFLAWIIKNNLEGEILKESEDSLNSLRNEEITGRELFEKECDEKLWEDDLNDEANAFAKTYYEQGTYFEDYELALCGSLPTLYHVENTWENYRKIAPLITARFEGWKKKNSKKKWQFWKR